MNLKIHPATDVSVQALREAMVDAFSDYAVPLRLSQPDFDLMMRQRGLDPASSRVATIDGEVAAIWLTSVRAGRAYLISSGTRPAYRSRGLARALAKGCLAHLRETGARSFQTEVLRSNKMALPLYLSLGMAKRRRLDCYRLPSSTALPASDAVLHRVDWADIAENAVDLRDWSPSWQNSDAAIAAISDSVACLAALDGAALAAFVAVNTRTGAVHQLAVRRKSRRRGLGLHLLKAAQKAAAGADLRLINVDADDEAFRALMARAGAEETMGQFELFMPL